MAVFDDTSQDEKLVLFDQRVHVEDRTPILQKKDSLVVELETGEPLRNECAHFIECVAERKTPLTDARSGNNVLEVLQACEISQRLNGRPTLLSGISDRKS
jgi:UDP-2-acetamido-3-amino-2,3-dideoxy-glucuronate N-acetyltransferase